MRVLTFLHSFEPGGVERVALRLVRRWRELGIDAPLFLGRADGALAKDVGAGLDFHAPRQPPFGTGWWETLWMVLTLPRHVRRVRPEVLFCAGNTYAVVAVAMKLLLGRDCPPILAKISNDLSRADLPLPARLMCHAWLRVQAAFIDRWVVMDPALLPEAAALLGDVDHVVVPDPAIDRIGAAPPAGASPAVLGPVRYCGVGRLVAQKDPAAMLIAFAEGAKPHDTLTMLGDGPLRAGLERLAADLGVAGRILFAGHVPDAAARLKDFDVMLVTSRYEGLPAAVVEALAAGTRVVAADCGPGVRALLAGGVGTLVAPGDRTGLARAVAEAPRLPFDRSGAHARARRFTLQGSAGLYLQAMADLASDRRAHPEEPSMEREAAR